MEMWYLLAPAMGTNNVVVTVNVPATQFEGVVAGAYHIHRSGSDGPPGHIRLGGWSGRRLYGHRNRLQRSTCPASSTA